MHIASGAAHRRGIVLIWGLALVGCAAPETARPSPTPSAAAPIAETPTAAATQAAGPTTTPESSEMALVVWTVEHVAAQSETPGGETLLEQLAAFDDIRPDIQVEFYIKRQTGEGSTLEYLRTAPLVAPDILPDIALLDRASLIQAARESLIVPIGPMLDPAPSDLYPVAGALGSVDGEMVGLPYVMDTQHVAYRQAYFDTEPPVSYGAILEGPTVYAFPAGSTSGVNVTTLTQYLAAGGSLTDPEGAPQLDSAVLATVLTFYDQAWEGGTLAPEIFQMSGPEDTWALYRGGQTGIADVTASLYLTERGRVRTTGLCWIPTQDGRPFALVSGWSWVIVTQDPERQEAALALIAYLMQPVNQGDYTLAAHYLPSQRSALAVWGNDPYAVFADTLLESAVPIPEEAALRPVSDALQDAVEAVLLRDALPAQAAAQAAETVSTSPTAP